MPDMTPTDDRPAVGEAPRPPYPSAPFPPSFEADEPLGPVVEDISDAEVRDKLTLFGGMLNRVMADDEVPDLWLWDADDLDALAPPLTRVLNKRSPRIRQALARTDELAVCVRLGSYVYRNVRARAAAAEAAAEAAAAAEPPADLPDGDPGRGPGSFGVER